MPEGTSRTLVVGSGGLLGGGVVGELSRRGSAYETVRVPWADHTAAVDALVAAAARLAAAGEPWRLLWCAGAGVVATDRSRLDAELATLGAFLDRLATDSLEALFLASSAGGVYAGSQDPPFTEATVPRPLAPYGEAKLEAEALVTAFAARTGVPVLVGRIANLYGPGQDPTKAQGLITVLCRSHVSRRPASIYVPLDTSRDYLFVSDAARLAVHGTERVAEESPGTVVTKIFASQQGTTVAAILGELRRITKHRPRVVLGASELMRFQARDLRVRSHVWPELDGLVMTSLPAGIAATMSQALRDHQRPSTLIVS